MAKKEFPSDKLDQYIVRFPEGMRDRIRDAAKANNRSMNAEIVARLEASFEIDVAEYRADTKRLEAMVAQNEKLMAQVQKLLDKLDT
jgi:hypothetical protein